MRSKWKSTNKNTGDGVERLYIYVIESQSLYTPSFAPPGIVFADAKREMEGESRDGISFLAASSVNKLPWLIGSNRGLHDMDCSVRGTRMKSYCLEPTMGPCSLARCNLLVIGSCNTWDFKPTTDSIARAIQDINQFSSNTIFSNSSLDIRVCIFSLFRTTVDRSGLFLLGFIWFFQTR